MNQPEFADLAAERAVLANIFRHGHEAFVDVDDIIATPGTFTLDSNQAIYRCLAHVLRENPEARPDLSLVYSAASSLGLKDFLDRPEERKHLRAITQMPVELANARGFAAKVRRLAIGKLVDEGLAKARRDLRTITGDEALCHILGLAERPIFDLTTALAATGGDGPRPLGENALAYVQHLMDHPREMAGISSGYRKLDLAIGGGFRPNSMDVIGARMKEGKTQLLDNMALHVAGTLGVNVLNLDTEMNAEEHICRVCANLAGLETEKIELGQYGKDADGRRRLEDAARRVSQMPYDYLCVNGMEPEEMLSHMRRWVLRKVGLGDDGFARPCVIFYDYLKLMSGGKLSDSVKEYQLLGFIATAIKNFAGKYKIAIPTFVQLNREALENVHSGVVGGSDRIAMYCTSLSVYLKRTAEEMGEQAGCKEKYTHKMIPLLTRHGKGLKPGDYINMRAEYHQSRVIEGPTAYELERLQDSQGFETDGSKNEF